MLQNGSMSSSTNPPMIRFKRVILQKAMTKFKRKKSQRQPFQDSGSGPKAHSKLRSIYSNNTIDSHIRTEGVYTSKHEADPHVHTHPCWPAGSSPTRWSKPWRHAVWLPKEAVLIWSRAQKNLVFPGPVRKRSNPRGKRTGKDKLWYYLSRTTEQQTSQKFTRETWQVRKAQ